MSFDSRRVVDKPNIDTVRYEVLASHLPLKKMPSLEAGVETEVLRGEIFNVYEEQNGWLFGQLKKDKYVGWVHSFLVDFDGSKSMIPAHERGRAVALTRTSNNYSPTHKVKVLRTFTYPAANMKLPHMGALSMGCAVQIVDIEGGFACTAQGEYIWAAHLCEIPVIEPDFVSVAEQFLRVPYLWGGKTSLGLDCSGLVQISLQAAGVECPRDSDMQFNELGNPVELNDVKRGDLVFWKGHVGIMVDSETLLHANGYHMMVVKEHFVGALERIKEKSFGEVIGVRRLG
jgi:cell wall-associated NlpC family hydrolase